MSETLVIDTFPTIDEKFLSSLTKIGGKRVGFAFLKYILIYLPEITSYTALQEYKGSLSKEERHQLCSRFIAFIANWHYSLRESALDKMMTFITRTSKPKSVYMKANVLYDIPMTQFRAIIAEYRGNRKSCS
jgi:hypothetical protein